MGFCFGPSPCDSATAQQQAGRFAGSDLHHFGTHFGTSASSKQLGLCATLKLWRHPCAALCWGTLPERCRPKTAAAIADEYTAHGGQLGLRSCTSCLTCSVGLGKTVQRHSGNPLPLQLMCRSCFPACLQAQGPLPFNSCNVGQLPD